MQTLVTLTDKDIREVLASHILSTNYGFGGVKPEDLNISAIINTSATLNGGNPAALSVTYTHDTEKAPERNTVDAGEDEPTPRYVGKRTEPRNPFIY